MKIACILILALVAGACAAPPTLEELEFEALQTGDWSAVERREKSIERRAERHRMSCPNGLIEYCESRGGPGRCECVDRRAIDALFGWN